MGIIPARRAARHPFAASGHPFRSLRKDSFCPSQKISFGPKSVSLETDRMLPTQRQTSVIHRVNDIRRQLRDRVPVSARPDGTSATIKNTIRVVRCQFSRQPFFYSLHCSCISSLRTASSVATEIKGVRRLSTAIRKATNSRATAMVALFALPR